MTTPTIQQALADVMADVREVRKTDRNEAQRFVFRGIDAVLNAVGPALRKHCVVVMPRVIDYTYGTVEVGQQRRPMAHVVATVEYTFTGPAGDSLAATVIGEAMDSGDKAVPKAMSVAFRTALLQALALPTDDADPDASSYERSEADESSTAGKTFAEFMDSITQAIDVDALNSIGKAIQRTTAPLSPTHKDALRRAFGVRKDQLEKATA